MIIAKHIQDMELVKAHLREILTEQGPPVSEASRNVLRILELSQNLLQWLDVGYPAPTKVFPVPTPVRTSPLAESVRGLVLRSRRNGGGDTKRSRVAGEP